MVPSIGATVCSGVDGVGVVAVVPPAFVVLVAVDVPLVVPVVAGVAAFVPVVAGAAGVAAFVPVVAVVDGTEVCRPVYIHEKSGNIVVLDNVDAGVESIFAYSLIR